MALLQPLKRRKEDRLAVTPGVSVIVPVSSPAPDLGRCVELLLNLDYPDYEIVLCAAVDDLAAVAVIQEQESRGAAQLRAFALQAYPVPNPKVGLLAAAIPQARHELLLFTDDNVISSATRLRAHLALLENGYGLVSAAALGVEPAGFWGEVDAAFMNGHFARLQLAGDTIGLSGVIGKTLLISRADLERTGGLLAVGDSLCEDSELQKRVAGIGGRTALSHEPVRQVIGCRTFFDVWNRHRRWFFCRRCQVPGVFLAEAVVSLPVGAVAGALLGAGLGAPWWAGPAGMACVLLILEWAFLCAARWRIGPLFPLVWLARELLVLPLCVMALVGGTVRWRKSRRVLAA